MYVNFIYIYMFIIIHIYIHKIYAYFSIDIYNSSTNSNLKPKHLSGNSKGC